MPWESLIRRGLSRYVALWVLLLGMGLGSADSEHGGYLLVKMFGLVARLAGIAGFGLGLLMPPICHESFSP